jgi:hypothetical protein
MGQDDVGRERGQFSRQFANLGGIGHRPTRFDAHVAADGPIQDRQRLQEGPDPGLKLRIVRACGQQHPDAPHAFALLRACGERPRRHVSEHAEEITAPHVQPPG